MGVDTQDLHVWPTLGSKIAVNELLRYIDLKFSATMTERSTIIGTYALQDSQLLIHWNPNRWDGSIAPGDEATSRPRPQR